MNQRSYSDLRSIKKGNKCGINYMVEGLKYPYLLNRWNLNQIFANLINKKTTTLTT